MSDVLDALTHLHNANVSLQSKLDEKQLEIQGLWRGIARAHSQLHQAELEIQRQKLLITRLEIALEQMDPGATPLCSPPRTPTPPIADL
jgi:hypothetical protein